MSDLDLLTQSLARNVKRWRNERGFTLDALAARAGVSRGMLIQIEQARTNVDDTIPAAALDLGGARPRVLVAEDHDVNQLLITAMLRQLGCDVDIANHGAEAVTMTLAERTGDRPYALVLMDTQGCDLSDAFSDSFTTTNREYKQETIR